jgi:hypothetical protein
MLGVLHLVVADDRRHAQFLQSQGLSQRASPGGAKSTPLPWRWCRTGGTPPARRRTRPEIRGYLDMFPEVEQRWINRCIALRRNRLPARHPQHGQGCMEGEARASATAAECPRLLRGMRSGGIGRCLVGRLRSAVRVCLRQNPSWASTRSQRVARMARISVRSRSLRRSLAGRFRSSKRPERSTSWGSLVRAQYRP